MRATVISFLAAAVLVGFGAGARAQQEVVETVKKGCETEIKKHCSDVTPGQGRVLACLYAYGDKLSGKCEFALYDAAVQLERAVAALSYVANECDADVDAHCADVQIGEGRLVKCLKTNERKISGRCKDAMKDVGLW